MSALTAGTGMTNKIEKPSMSFVVFRNVRTQNANKYCVVPTVKCHEKLQLRDEMSNFLGLWENPRCTQEIV